ncbi:MAG: alpha/beta fold hydrolase [Sphingomonadaceae bacterium]
MTYIATNTEDCELYAKEWGPKTGKPVILIHGWPLNADSWDDVALGLATAGFRTIAYDRRGFGRSDQPWEGYDYDTLADDLACVIEACGVNDAALVGFSMGGGEVARYMAKHDGAKIGRVALIASVLPYLLKTSDNPDGIDQSVFDDVMDKLTEDRAGFLQTFIKQFYGVGLLDRPVSQGVLDASFQAAMMAGQWPTVACARAWSTTDFRQDVAAITVPTLIIHGTSDKNVPIEASSRRTAEMIAHAQFIEYDGAPHGALATHTTEITRDLIAFLNAEEVAGREEMKAPHEDALPLQPMM